MEGRRISEGERWERLTRFHSPILENEIRRTGRSVDGIASEWKKSEPRGTRVDERRLRERDM